MTDELIDRIYVSTPAEVAGTKLDNLAAIPHVEYTAGINDILIPYGILADARNLLQRVQPGGWELARSFLQLCSLLECIVLSDSVIVRLPADGAELAMSAVSLAFLEKAIGLSRWELGSVVKFSTACDISSSKHVIGFNAQKHLVEHNLRRIEKGMLDKCGSPEVFDGYMEREGTELEKALQHLIHDKVASDIGCSYVAGYSAETDIYGAVQTLRRKALRAITPLRLYDAIKARLNTESAELAQMGWSCGLPIPPLALNILQGCRGQSKHIGEVVLELRDEAAAFRKWNSEVRNELVNAASHEAALKAKRKLERVYQDFAGNDGSESWRITSWNGLLAAFPMSVWDGLTKEDIDAKSLVGFITEKPLQAIRRLVMRRNYLFILDAESKFRKMKDYAAVIEKALGYKFSEADIASLRNLSRPAAD